MAKSQKKSAPTKTAQKKMMPAKITGKSKGVVPLFDRFVEHAAGRKMVLHIGCGKPKPGKLHKSFEGDDWFEIRLDIDPDADPDIISDMLDMNMIPDGAVHAVWSSHNIEHLYPHDVPSAIKEIYRVIKRNGHFLVTLPDIQTVAQYVAHGQLEEPIYDSPAGPISAIDIMYGLRSSMARGNLFMAHKTGYTAKTLGRYLTDSGFRSIRISRDWINLWAIGHKFDREHPDYHDDIRVHIAHKNKEVPMPPPMPINRSPHPGKMYRDKLSDELDVLPCQWQES